MASRKISVADVEAIIDEYEGNVGKMANRLKVSHMTVRRRINESPALAAKFNTIRESRIDNVEDVLIVQALKGEAWAVCFFLKTQGKSRGYTERQEVTGADGGDLVIRFTWDDGEDN